MDEKDAAFDNRELVETPNGTIMLELSSESVARATCGLDNGWLTLDGRTLYATAMFTRPGGGATWMINPLYGAVTDVVGGKAGARVDGGVRDAAWAVLKETFEAWLPTRPDIVAGVALAARRREERSCEERAEELRAELARVEAGLPALKAARESAEAAFEAASEPSAGPAP